MEASDPAPVETRESSLSASPLARVRSLAAPDALLSAHLQPQAASFMRAATAELITAPALTQGSRGLRARVALEDAATLEIARPEVGGHALRLTLAGAQRSRARLEEGHAVAQDVLRDTDMVITSTFDRVEILLSLKSAAAPSTFAWSVELGERLRAAAMADGGIALEDGATPGQPVLRIPPAFALDADGKRVPVELSWTEGHLLARLSTDGLRYPILVDPAFETYLWEKLTPAASPESRYLHGAVFDDARNVGVVFGGDPGNQADTWEWSGTTWTRICPGVNCGGSATGRRGHVMAFDSARNVTVMFGGRIVSANQQDTWEWNGTKWTELCTGGCSKPSVRTSAAMAFDAQRAVSVLFGGTPANQETWTWNGTSWSQQCTSAPCSDTRPESRSGAAMAYDANRKVVVLFGGLNAAASDTLQDTWEWNGSAWSQKCVSGCTPPGKRARHAMAYDQQRKRVVLVGGLGPDAISGPLKQDTWEWDGSSWSNTASAGVTSLQAAAAFYDSARKRTLLFGGSDDVNLGTSKAETWIYHARGAQCSAAGTCDTGFCVDGVCCEVSSCAQCYSCDVYDAANGYYPGTCNPVRNAEDTSGTTCSGNDICSSAASPVCKKKNGQGCAAGTECASNNCVDSTCCSSSCTAACKSCANAAGTCTTNIGSGSTDTNASPACSGNNVCDGAGACKAKQGQTCDAAADCATGYCVDGRCCAEACTATCKSCANAAGTCSTNVASETVDGNASPACSGNNVCDGSGSCKKKRGQDCADADECASGFCSSGKCCDKACSGACDTCASGTCGFSGAGTPGSPSCNPYLCAANNAACPISCSTSAQCASEYWCDGSKCQPDKQVGDECDAKEECPLNVNCVDGVCCDGGCSGPCVACTALKKGSGVDGACGPIANGADPRAPGCSTGVTSCDADGKCDGAGACRTQAPQTTSCGNGTTCEGNSVKGQRCNGAGDCINSGDAFPCTPAACSNGACTTSCTGASGCDPQYGFCNLQGVCETKKGVKAECGSDDECMLGHCVDGSCCETACDGACESCESGSCAKLLATSPGEPSCEPFVCDGEHAECPDTCTDDEVCVATFFCKVSDNTCQPRENGTACNADDQCPDKHCVDGVCCETACDGQCERCDDAGKCVAVVGSPIGERPACPGHADCAGSCDGANRAECTGAKTVGTSCGEASCAANIGRVGACDAAAACKVAEVACHPFICGDSECKAECEADGDCQEGYACAGGDCQLSSTKCSDDGASVIGADDKSTPCDPYVCEAGACLTSCSNSLDCQVGKVCNTEQGNGVCEATQAGAASEEDAGCSCRAASGRGSQAGYSAALLLSALVLLRRRRSLRCVSA